MVGFIVGLIINTIAFLVISKILPGFRIESPRTAGIVSVVYGIIMTIALYTLVPIFVVVAGILMIPLVFIPFLGPLIAGGTMFMAVLTLVFVISVVTLIATDKLLEDFEMKSMGTAAGAAALLAILNVGTRMVLPF